MANFKVGDEVVLISTQSLGGGYDNNNTLFGVNSRPGQRFIVEIMNDKCAGLRGLKQPTDVLFGKCGTCAGYDLGGYWHIACWRLIKLDGLTEHHEEKETANA